MSELSSGTRLQGRRDLKYPCASDNERLVQKAPSLFCEDSWAHGVKMKDYLDSLSEEEREEILRPILGS